MAKTPAKKPAKAAPQKATKATAKVKPAQAVAAKSMPSKATPMGDCCSTTSCCATGVDTSRAGCLCRCHLFSLLRQSRTWGVWVITFAMLLSLGNFLMPMPEAIRPMLFHVGNHAFTALAFALLFRLAFTGCGGLIEGGKLGMLIFVPLASLTVFLTFASVPPFFPLMGMGIVLPVLKAGAFYLLIGVVAGVLSSWYLKPSCCCK